MGVDSKNVDESIKLVHHYLKEIQKGNFSEEKYNNAKKSILKGKKQIEDSQFSTSMTKITSGIYDYDNSYEKAVIEIENLDKSDVIDFGKKINYLGSYSIVSKEDKSNE